MKNKFLIILIAILAVIFAIFYVFDQKNTKNERNIKNNPQNTQKILKIGDILLNVNVANTNEEREKGLSGKEKLANKEGMLFVFDKDGYYGIWMKDMKFAIDIAWLDSDKKIIYIEKNVSPSTYPKIFYAQKADLPAISRYVIEVNAGFFENSKIKIGDIAEF